MIQIDLRSREPIYEQLIKNIKELIFSGVLKTDEKLPSVREIARQLTINPNTIQKAFKALETEGYIYSARGRGHFVMSMKENKSAEQSLVILNQIKELIKEANYIGISKEDILTIMGSVYTDSVTERGELSDTD